MCIFIQYLAFSGTSLLTRCHSASCCFLLFLCFRKVVQEIFSELHGTKNRGPYFFVTKPEPEGELKGGHRVARHVPGAASPGPTSGPCLGPPGLRRLRPFAHII